MKRSKGRKKLPGKRKSARKQKSSPPLSLEALQKAKIEVRRHPVSREPISAATFDVVAGSAQEQPAVSTRLYSLPSNSGEMRWRVEIRLDSGRITPAMPPPIKPVIVKRPVLQRVRAAGLYPSMPDDGSKFEKPPGFLPWRAPFKLRHADIEYDPTTIFTPDGRGPYFDTNYPWCCLCKVQTPTGQGSGVLIGPRHVVTASHVVDWTPGWAVVNVLLQNTTSLDSANATLAYASTRIGPGQIGDSDGDEDYAVLVLDKRLGDTFGWYGSKTYDSAWDDETSNWCNLGYPSDRGWGGTTPVFQKDFLLNELGADYGSARLIRSQTFDNWPGQSGGPVFGFWNDGPYVVGIVSGQDADYNYISGGSLLPSLISQARSENP